MTNAAVRESTLKALQGSTLTRHHGRPTFKSVAKTRKEVAQEFAKAKTSHSAFPMGTKFGMAAAVLKTRSFIEMHNTAAVNIPGAEELDEAWEFEHPTRPDPYDETELEQGLSAQQRDMRRRKQEAVRNEELIQYDVFEAYETYYKDAMAAAYDDTYFDTIKDELLGFSHLTVNAMLEHLREQCLAMTFKEKKKKLKEININWDHGDDIRVFLRNVQKLKDQLDDEYGIEWADDMRMTHVLSEFYDSAIFTEEEMMDWEDQPAADQTYAAMVTYFKNAYDKHARFGSARRPASQGYESANRTDDANGVSDQQKEELLQLMLQLLSNQKEVAEAATADKEHLQAMSDSNSELLDIIKKLTKQNEKLTEQNSSLVEALAKAKASRGGGGGRGGGRSGWRTTNDQDGSAGKPKCAICGKIHKTENCYELEKNKDLRKDGWKSIFE